MIKKHYKRIIACIAGAVLLLAAAFGIYILHQMNQITKVDIPKSNAELNIGAEAADVDNKIINIALFGVDSRNRNIKGLSDSIMVLSIDENKNNIKVFSIMRDTYVEVENHGMTKINHAYAYGGPTLAIKTLNKNFNLNIKDYISIDYGGFEKIIDSIGGVDIGIKSYELPKMKTVGISSAGTYTLTGKQALAYARIRKYGNSDYERTERQRTVLKSVLLKVQGEKILKLTSMVDSTLPYLETSMDKLDIIKLGTAMISSDINLTRQTRFPQDGYCHGELIKGIYYLVTDLPATTAQIYQFIYDEVKTTGNSNEISDWDKEPFGAYAYSKLEYIQNNLFGRIAGSQEEKTALNYIKSELLKAGYPENSLSVQNFSFKKKDGKTYYSQNLIAVKKGKSEKTIVVGAHYDSVNTHGVDDNGSGTAVVLETAARLADQEPPYTIQFVFFGSEEPGKRGSAYFVKTLSAEDKQRLCLMINLDCVVAGDKQYIFGGVYKDDGTFAGTWAEQQAKEIADRLGLVTYLNPDIDPDISPFNKSDHIRFRDIGIPYLFLWTGNLDIVPYKELYETEKLGKIMHSSNDDLSVIEQNFNGRPEKLLHDNALLLYHLLSEMNLK